MFLSLAPTTWLRQWITSFPQPPLSHDLYWLQHRPTSFSRSSCLIFSNGLAPSSDLTAEMAARTNPCFSHLGRALCQPILTSQQVHGPGALGDSTIAKGGGGMWSRGKEIPSDKWQASQVLWGSLCSELKVTVPLPQSCSHHTWNEAPHSNPQTRREPGTEWGLADQERETGTGNKPRGPGKGMREARGHNLSLYLLTRGAEFFWVAWKAAPEADKNVTREMRNIFSQPELFHNGPGSLWRRWTLHW